MRSIRKAVVPAAGRGTRLFPVTRVVPKELLPVGGKPMIHRCVEEAFSAGCEELYVIANPAKRLIRDYFLHAGSRLLRDYVRLGRIRFLYQKGHRGLADAISCARRYIGNNPFALLLPDNVTFAQQPVIAQLEETFERYGNDTIAVAHIPAAFVPTFSLSGRIDWEEERGRAVRITRLYPKRKGMHPPSRRAGITRAIGRAVLTPCFFKYIEALRGRVKGELDDGPVFRQMARRRGVMGHRIDGIVFDAGNKAGFAAANSWVAGRGDGKRK
jgi:UTP--glucose-1-phosphate uridylyltransferase